MSCVRCQELHVRFEVRTQGELAKAIRVIHANLDDGTLEQTRRDGIGASTTPFRMVSDSGPWPDVLLCTFACRLCGATFRLSVDAYHGSGGEWIPELATG